MNALQVAERSATYALQTAAPSISGEAFDLMATAPQGVAKLRELILALAVRGKLVPQNAKDGSAASLLERIDAEYKRLVTRGESNGRKQLLPIPNDDAPFIVPDSWTWTRIGALGGVVGGGTPNSHDSTFWAVGNEIPWLTPADLYGLRDKQAGRGRRDITAAGLASSSAQLVPAGTVLFSSRAPIGYVAIAAHPLATNQGFKSCVPHLPELADYLYWYLKQAGKAIDAAASGTTFKEISGSKFAEVAVPLPPLAEQHRIVARVEELMGLCDELDTHGHLQDEQHARLVATLFDALVASVSPAELAANWQRVASHFDLLLDRPEAVDGLEQTILQLAVRGLLVPQDPDDLRATILIAGANVRGLDDRPGAYSLSSRSVRSIDAAVPFDVPTNWRWETLDAICDQVVDCPHSTPKFRDAGVLCLDTNSFKGGRLIDRKLRYVSPETYAERVARIVPRAGDLVLAREGSVGESVLIPANTKCCLGQRVMLFRFSQNVLNTYVQMAISAKGFLDGLLALNKGIGAKHVNVRDVKAAEIPIPPLAEQHRIVTRVEELRSLCADLRQRLQQARATQSNLADAVVARTTV